MKKLFEHILLLSLITAIIAISDNSYAQRRGRSRSDSLRQSILRRDSMMRTLKKSDTSLNSLLQKVEYYSNSFNQISVDLTRGFDTIEISQQLPRYKKRIATIKKLIDNDRSNTLRYLYAIRDFLTHTEDQLDEWQDELAQNNSKLVQMRGDLNEIQKDATFHTLPEDTSLQQTATQPIKAVLSKHRKLDSLNKISLLKIGLLQNKLADIYLAILDEKDQINAKIRKFSERAVSGEYDPIWNMHGTRGASFKQALDDTINMNSKLLLFLLSRDAVIHLIGFTLLILFFVWVYSNRQRIFKTKDDPRQILAQANYVAALPIVASLIVTTVLQPYFYDHPPAIFLECIFLVNIIAVLILVYRTCPRNYFNFLLYLFGITVIYAISNLFVEVSDTDRIITLLIAAVNIVVCWRFLTNLRRDNDRPPYSILVIKTYMLLQLLSFIANVMGRFTLAKIIGVTVTFNLGQGISLYLFVQILMQSLFLQIEASKGESIISSYLDFKLLQNKFRNILNIIAIILWCITLIQNLSVEDLVYDNLGDFLTQSRTVGGTLFTFGSVIIFVAVIWLSMVVSRIISYFYDFSAQQRAGTTNRKNRTSILLIKITVFALGFILAVAASGVPLDKITIILSAFGVGIGFGLQNIVNNLVSGLILAFEKPVQVGDVIEVASRTGTITEIGIRSSKIATGNGAEVIVPNGDLISQHVINWTLSNSNRQVELIIGVAYGTEIQKVLDLLKKLLAHREDIMMSPAPSVYVHALNESSVDFRILFWVADISQWVAVKSRVLTEIYDLMKQNNIEIPYPQRDINIHLDKDAAIAIKQNPADPAR